MRHAALSLAIAATLLTGGCLQKETTSTIYLRHDGSFDWVIFEQNVRSDERDEAARLAEESGYLEGVSRGDTSTVSGLLALGAKDVRLRWLRRTRPYGVMVDARFDDLASVLDRMLSPCGIPYQTRITESEGVTTWTLSADVGPGGDRLEDNDGEGCGNGLEDLSDALDFTIILESGTFTASTGFVRKADDAASLDNDAITESVRTTGVVELSLSWR